MQSLVSIIIPAYNAEKSIINTVDSILKQNYLNFEVLIINDGSTDNTEQVSKSINDSRVKIINKENGGLVSAYICGINKSNGKYIMFCDSDDTYKENILSMLVEKMEETNVDFSCYTYDLVTDTNKLIHHSKNFYNEGVIKKENYKELVYPNFIFNCDINNFYYTLLVMRWLKIYKKDLLLKILPDLNENVSQMEDNIITYLSVLNSESFYVSNISIYNYVSYPESMSKKFDEKIFEKYETSLNHIEYILNKYHFNTNLKQLDYLKYDVYRVIFRRASKALSYKESKKVLNKIREKTKVLEISFRNIKALKNKIFYFLDKIHFDYMLYLIFNKA